MPKTPAASELSQALAATKEALAGLEDWRTRIGKLTNQLSDAEAEGQAALADHSAEAETRVERIAAAQIRSAVVSRRSGDIR